MSTTLTFMAAGTFLPPLFLHWFAPEHYRLYPKDIIGLHDKAVMAPPSYGLSDVVDFVAQIQRIIHTPTVDVPTVDVVYITTTTAKIPPAVVAPKVVEIDSVPEHAVDSTSLGSTSRVFFVGFLLTAFKSLFVFLAMLLNDFLLFTFFIYDFLRATFRSLVKNVLARQIGQYHFLNLVLEQVQDHADAVVFWFCIAAAFLLAILITKVLPLVKNRFREVGEHRRALARHDDELRLYNGMLNPVYDWLRRQRQKIDHLAASIVSLVTRADNVDASINEINHRLNETNLHGVRAGDDISTMQVTLEDVFNQLSVLSNQYTTLSAEHAALRKDYDNLHNDLSTLSDDYRDLNTKHRVLEIDHEELSRKHTDVFKTYERSYKNLIDQINCIGFKVAKVDDDFGKKVDGLRKTVNSITSKGIKLYLDGLPEIIVNKIARQWNHHIFRTTVGFINSKGQLNHLSDIVLGVGEAAMRDRVSLDEMSRLVQQLADVVLPEHPRLTPILNVPAPARAARATSVSSTDETDWDSTAAAATEFAAHMGAGRSSPPRIPVASAAPTAPVSSTPSSFNFDAPPFLPGGFSAGPSAFTPSSGHGFSNPSAAPSFGQANFTPQTEFKFNPPAAGSSAAPSFGSATSTPPTDFNFGTSTAGSPNPFNFTGGASTTTPPVFGSSTGFNFSAGPSAASAPVSAPVSSAPASASSPAPAPPGLGRSKWAE